jgi:hypothetical protein
MTLDTYAELFESDIDSVGNPLDEAYGEVISAPATVSNLAKTQIRRVG